jgi:porin
LNEETYEYNTLYENNNGLYATVDQMILKGEEESSIAFFLRGSVSPKKYNNNFSFYGGGICCHSLLSFDTDGILALGFLHASLQREDNETVVELTYKTPVTKNIFLQPDIQYIINPAGTHRELQNCLVGTIRYGIAF